jgi:hypothetical protein
MFRWPRAATGTWSEGADDPPGAGQKYDIIEIEPERRYGYQWGGGYGAPLLAYARSVGY